MAVCCQEHGKQRESATRMHGRVGKWLHGGRRRQGMLQTPSLGSACHSHGCSLHAPLGLCTATACQTSIAKASVPTGQERT